MTLDTVQTASWFVEVGEALGKIPVLESDLADARSDNAAAETLISALQRDLADAVGQLETANEQIAALTKQRGTFEVDAKFDSDRMRWYGKLREALAAYSATIRTVAQTRTPEVVGFSVRDHVEYAAWALRATGDVWLREEVAEVMGIVRARTDFNPTTYKDITFLTSLYALTAYVLCGGETPHPDGAYWKARAVEACATSVPGDNIMHPYTASCLTAWLLWLLTGEDRFRIDAELRRDELRRSIQLLESGRAVWYHRPKFAESLVYGHDIQALTYARYVIADLALLAALGFEVIAPDALIKTVEFVTSVEGNLYYWLDGETHPNSNGLMVQFDQPKLTTSNLGFVMSDVLRVRFEAMNYSTPYVPAALVGDRRE